MSLFDLLSGTPVSEALGWTLLHSLWEGLLAAAALGVFLALIRAPRARYTAAGIVLLLVFASFAITLVHFLPANGGSEHTLIQTTRAAGGELPEWAGTNHEISRILTLIPWLTPLWLAGVCLFYLRYVFSWLSLQRLQRRGVCSAPSSWQLTVKRLALELQLKRPVVLLESILAETPLVLGYFRPAVMVPLGFLTGFPADCVEVILLHELAHIRRSDYLVNACQRILEGLFFYHPAVWWISRVIRTERENCCDDMVVMLRGNPHRYATALTALEQNRLERQLAARNVVVAATGGDLMKRVKRLLYPQNPSGLWTPVLAAALLFAGSTFILGAWHANKSPASVTEQAEEQLAGQWQKWLDEDVVYIISKGERVAFLGLKSDEERQNFVEQFWAQRDPTPGTAANEFKEEHYRRIAYANKHWAYKEGPGWKSGRGQTYILHGPPDEIDSHPSGGRFERPASEGGGLADTYAFEDWGYRRAAGASNWIVEFIDPTRSGEYRIAANPDEKYRTH
jgi:GWxTD domain-containing protein